MIRPPPSSTLFPYTTALPILFEIARTSDNIELRKAAIGAIPRRGGDKVIDFLIALYDTEKNEELKDQIDRKSTRLNSSHGYISYAVFCLKKKKKMMQTSVACK